MTGAGSAALGGEEASGTGASARPATGAPATGAGDANESEGREPRKRQEGVKETPFVSEALFPGQRCVSHAVILPVLKGHAEKQEKKAGILAS